MKIIAHILARFRLKLSRIWFHFFQARYLAGCGSKTHVFAPFRIEGMENIRLGKNTVIQASGWLYCLPIEGREAKLTIGSDCVFGYNNHITSVSNVIIEDKVLTANNVYISDNVHSFENIDIPIIDQPVRFKRAVRIGFGTWIGENVSIIGATVGRNCVIGSNSVVTRDIPDYSVAVGAPAEIIKYFDPGIQAWVTVKKEKEVTNG
jgi:acetyltransferase-like isoleucine patch superfamily enzyme